MTDRDLKPENVRLQDTIVRQLLQWADDVREIAGCRPLIQIAVTPEVFSALAAEVHHDQEPGEPNEIRFVGGINVATFDAVALREGFRDMLTGTKTLAKATDERAALREENAFLRRQLDAVHARNEQWLHGPPVDHGDLRAALAEALTHLQRNDFGRANDEDWAWWERTHKLVEGK